MGNTFGQLFRVTTFGESHGGGIGVVIDGCPPRVEISESDIQRELDRRRPGQSKLTTQRKEQDRCEILSGVFEGKTLGTAVAIQFGTETLGLKITSRSQANFARHTPIILMRRNTEFETGRAAVARPRAKRLDGSPQARLRKGYCLRCMPTSKSSPT